MTIISVKADISGALAKLALATDQVPYATALALTRTAQFVQKELASEMDKAFDRPTPFTKNGMRVVPATKSRLAASVDFKDRQAKYLTPEVYGGPRGTKGFERLLQGAGILPSGWYAVPAQGVHMDRYGNVPGGTLTKILSQLNALKDSLQHESAEMRRRRNLTRQQGRYFAVIPDRPARNRLKPGIYERLGTTRIARVLPIFMFVRQAPTYRERYNFRQLGEIKARQRFPTEFEAAAETAMRTRR